MIKNRHQEDYIKTNREMILSSKREKRLGVYTVIDV